MRSESPPDEIGIKGTALPQTTGRRVDCGEYISRLDQNAVFPVIFPKKRGSRGRSDLLGLLPIRPQMFRRSFT